MQCGAMRIVGAIRPAQDGEEFMRVQRFFEDDVEQGATIYFVRLRVCFINACAQNGANACAQKGANANLIFQSSR